MSSDTEETAAAAAGADDDSQSTDIPPEATLSKSQLKKLKRKEKWQQVKAQKRKAEKERYKARKKACRERGEDVGPTRKQLKHNRMTMSSCKLRVVIDCDFDNYMADKDIKMLVKQIQFSYSANRRAENPLQFYCCGVGGKTRERLESLGDYKGWDIRFRRESYSDMFDKSSIVYLSSESPNILESLDDDKIYIIGGLVDHNHHKGLCHRLAEEKGVAHAQLPISDHIDMKTRKVLTINHVFEILLHYTETRDWQKAIYTVLPPRKRAVPKQLNDTVKSDNSKGHGKSRSKNNDASQSSVTVKDSVKTTDTKQTSVGNEKEETICQDFAEDDGNTCDKNNSKNDGGTSDNGSGKGLNDKDLDGRNNGDNQETNCSSETKVGIDIENNENDRVAIEGNVKKMSESETTLLGTGDGMGSAGLDKEGLDTENSCKDNEKL